MMVKIKGTVFNNYYLVRFPITHQKAQHPYAHASRSSLKVKG